MSDKSLEIINEILVEQKGDDIFNVWLLDEKGKKFKSICGYPKGGVPRVMLKQGLTKNMVCNSPSGWGTPSDIGFCKRHVGIRLDDKSNSFYQLAKLYSENSTLKQSLEDIEGVEINLSDVSTEIKMLSALQLQLMRWIEDHPDDDTQETWNPTRISWAVSLLKDIIKAKETASRIEGSMRLEMSTLKQVVEMIMSFLRQRLEAKNIPTEVVFEIMSEMVDEVFVPLTNQSMITDKNNLLELRNTDD